MNSAWLFFGWPPFAGVAWAIRGEESETGNFEGERSVVADRFEPADLVFQSIELGKLLRAVEEACRELALEGADLLLAEVEGDRLDAPISAIRVDLNESAGRGAAVGDEAIAPVFEMVDARPEAKCSVTASRLPFVGLDEPELGGRRRGGRQQEPAKRKRRDFQRP